MRVLEAGDAVPDDFRGGVVAIGNFDGVHRGHQALLAVASAEARRARRPWGVLTFEPHPRTFFRPSEPLFRLSPPDLKSRLIAGLGADFLMTIPFDRALAALEPDAFVATRLLAPLAPSTVVTGYDFHFGHGRKGNPDTMRRLGAELGFAVSVVEQVTDESGLSPFSSSTIRGALRHGRVREAADGLGYWWMLAGPPVRGDGRGRSLGFPTANIVIDDGVDPKEGIYAVRVGIDRRWHDGVAYIGDRPTFATGRRFLEVFLFDFDRELYGVGLDVAFLDFIRPDRAFESTDALVAQMRADCDQARTALAAIAADDPMRRHLLGRLQAEARL
ncbi:MAG TPA: bifunctional riboflavin kinase/FAD synthetase [Allosphingosinicella sp.]|nr:bifunctional riboflavin kinase/FAD synthetase [Allosphingosinicella sp.]